MPHLLPGIPGELADYALKRLREHGVDVRLGTAVDRVDEHGLRTQDGDEVPTRTVVWTAGVRPAPLVNRLDVPMAKNGRIQVDPFLEVVDRPGVYAIGDIAAFEEPATGKLLPPSAAVAVQEAKALADILVARMEQRAAAPFRYVHKGELISLGRHEAVAEVKGIRLTGFPAWLTWRAFYLSQLLGFKNQLTVALDWTFAYLYQRDTVRLDVPRELAEEQAETGAGGR
jgi:NADH dehydrogenase